MHIRLSFFFFFFKTHYTTLLTAGACGGIGTVDILQARADGNAVCFHETNGTSDAEFHVGLTAFAMSDFWFKKCFCENFHEQSHNNEACTHSLLYILLSDND